MTKQEKLRKRVAVQCYMNAILTRLFTGEPLDPVDWDELSPERQAAYWERADEIIHIFVLHGAAFKVEKKLPILEWDEVKGIVMEVDMDTWAEFLVMLDKQLDKILEEGFSAFDSLVKGGKK